MMPHESSYVRLRPSSIHGVGVFAIKDIPNGFRPFPKCNSQYTVVNDEDIQKLIGEDRKLYEDFAVFDDGKVYCPESFDMMDTSWYLNHSDTPNCIYDNTFEDFVTRRTILAGEELTSNYGSYSER